jgi:plasmid stabilization system protein ParE
MNRPVIIRPTARAELAEAMDWYEDRRPGLGDDLETEIQAVFDEIARYPDRFPIVMGDTRQVQVRVYPYCVYYRVRSNRVIVTGVVHTARDPSVWQRRT